MNKVESVVLEREQQINVYDADKDGDICVEILDGVECIDLLLTPLDAGELIEILKAKLGEE